MNADPRTSHISANPDFGLWTLKEAAISTSASSLFPARIAHSFRTPRSATCPGEVGIRTPHSFHPAGPRARRDCRRRCSFLRFLAIISQRRHPS
jgi:hypothetical protein